MTILLFLGVKIYFFRGENLSEGKPFLSRWQKRDSKAQEGSKKMKKKDRFPAILPF